jgi:predicted Zn-dependent protease
MAAGMQHQQGLGCSAVGLQELVRQQQQQQLLAWVTADSCLAAGLAAAATATAGVRALAGLLVLLLLELAGWTRKHHWMTC